MDYLGYLFAGFAVFWAGLFAYLLWLQARLRQVKRQVELLEERLAEAEDTTPTTRATTGRP
jgi:CcmD family protein